MVAPTGTKGRVLVPVGATNRDQSLCYISSTLEICGVPSPVSPRPTTPRARSTPPGCPVVVAVARAPEPTPSPVAVVLRPPPPSPSASAARPRAVALRPRPAAVAVALRYPRCRPPPPTPSPSVPRCEPPPRHSSVYFFYIICIIFCSLHFFHIYNVYMYVVAIYA